MSVENNYDEYVLTRGPVETPKPFFQPDSATLSSSRSAPITASKSTLYPSVTLPADLFFLITRR